MKIRTTYMCLILSFGFLVNSESVSSQTDRNKRSTHLQNVLKQLSKVRDKPFWRNIRQAATKRSEFDELNLDELFSDLDLFDLDSSMPDYIYDDGVMDLKPLAGKIDLPSLNDLPDIPPETEKDEMSNVIPGAKDPFGNIGKHNEILDLTKPYNHDELQDPFQLGGGSMISELLELLELKEQGLLDSCLARYRKRR